jgi:hypothetical protein
MEGQPLLRINSKVPDFTLLDLAGNSHSLEGYKDQIVIINFWSAECPWSQRSDEQIIQYLQQWGPEVQYLPIASNANEDRTLIQEVATTRQLALILHDPDHAAADLFGALTTPHIFVIDTEGILRYQGGFDDVTFRQPEPTTNYLYQAVEALRAGNLPTPAETLAYGCTIVRVSL